MKVKMRKEERAKRKKASVRQIREGESEMRQKRKRDVNEAQKRYR